MVQNIYMRDDRSMGRLVGSYIARSCLEGTTHPAEGGMSIYSAALLAVSLAHRRQFAFCYLLLETGRVKHYNAVVQSHLPLGQRKCFAQH